MVRVDGTHFREDATGRSGIGSGPLVRPAPVESLATRDPKLVTLALRALQSRHIQGADQLSRDDANRRAPRIEHLDHPQRTAHLLTTPVATIDLQTGVGPTA